LQDVLVEYIIIVFDKARKHYAYVVIPEFSVLSLLTAILVATLFLFAVRKHTSFIGSEVFIEKHKKERLKIE